MFESMKRKNPQKSPMYPKNTTHPALRKKCKKKSMAPGLKNQKDYSVLKTKNLCQPGLILIPGVGLHSVDYRKFHLCETLLFGFVPQIKTQQHD